MLRELIKVRDSIKAYFPDLSQAPDAIQSEWIVLLNAIIDKETKQHIARTQQAIELLINATPSGDFRNLLTDVNMQLMHKLL